jgi:hypothetical protein
VSPLELTFINLCQFLFLNTRVFLCRILVMHAAPLGGSPTVSLVNGCGYRGKGDGPGVLPGQRQVHGGGGGNPPPPFDLPGGGFRNTPSEFESSRRDNEEEDEDKEDGEVTQPPHSSSTQMPPFTWQPLPPASGDLCWCVLAETTPDGDRAIDRSAVIVRHHTGIF